MATEGSMSPPDLLRRITVPIAGLVVVLVAAASYVTWSTSDFAMSFLAMGVPTETFGFGVFFGLIVVMMVAMMLPAALPMILAFHAMTRLEAGRPMKPADAIATTLFILPYFLLWGGFGVLALVGLMALGLLSPLVGLVAFIPAATLIAAGVYQVSRSKEVCLTQCQSPMSFVTLHWQSGRMGAVRMGLRHAGYCLGCCWLFMIVLFVAGSMNLLWMGLLSGVIFAEKVATRPQAVARGIAALLVVLGGIAIVQGYLAF